MLVLTRKVGEGIAIGDDVKIVVMQVKGKQVRLGIKADPSTIVHREEIYQKIQEENIKASMIDKNSLADVSKIFAPQNRSEQVPGSPLRRRRLMGAKQDGADDLEKLASDHEKS